MLFLILYWTQQGGGILFPAAERQIGANLVPDGVRREIGVVLKLLNINGITLA